MPTRYIAIGDIHGCAFELEKLLEKLSLSGDDRLIFLGDLVNKGPQSLRVLEIARRAGAISLLGNHEHRIREYRKSRNLALLKKEDLPTIAQMGPQDWAFIDAMPLTHYVPEIDTIFVHGGFLPKGDWRDQPAEVVTRIQVIDRQGRARKRNEVEGCPIWADKWEGPSYVVYGHTPRMDVYETPTSICIDTACVMGGKLTALILPEKKIVQVRAKQIYCEG